MWIDSIEYLGFGSIIGEKIQFEKDKLNLVIEPNEFGKSTMAESVWAILYGLEYGQNSQADKEAFKPWETQAPYAGIIDLSVSDKNLRIIRNFDDGSFQVLDRDSQDDITSEYVDSDNTDSLGYRLTGMTRELFRNTCLLGQRHLDEHHAGGNLELRDDLKSLADSSKPGSTSISATDIIQEALNKYPCEQGLKPIEEVIADLEYKKTGLINKIEALDNEKTEVSGWLSELSDIDIKLKGKSSGAMEVEFNNLKIKKIKLEEQREGFKDRKSSRDKIEQRLLELSTKTPLAEESLKSLREMWTRRESRIQDLTNLSQDSKPGQEEYELIEQQLSQNYPNFDKFQFEEVNIISTLAVSMYNLRRELESDRHELQATTGTRLNNLIDSENALTNQEKGPTLSQEELEEARSYSSLMVAFNEQLADSKKRLQEAEFSRGDIEEKQKSNRLGNFAKGAGCFILMAACFMISNFDMPNVIKGFPVGIALLSLIVGFVLVGKGINYKRFMFEELESAQNEEQKIKKVFKQSTTKVANLESTLSTYATKAGLGTKEELVEMLQKASSVEELHDEQVSKENLIKTKEQQLKKLEADLTYYFDKIERKVEQVDSQRAMDLSQDIKQYFEERTRLDEQFAEIKTTRKQMDFLEAEVNDIEDQIRPLLDVSGLDQVSDLDDLAQEIEELVSIVNEREGLNDELSKIEYDMSGYEQVVSSEVQLQAQITEINDQIAEMILQNPDLANCPEPDPDNPPTAVIPWGDSEEDKEALRKSKEEITVKIRTQTSNRDSNYLPLTEELATLEHELVCAKRAKLALELAKSKLQESSSKTYEDWSIKLNESAAELVGELNGDFESLSFDSDLNITLKLKGMSEPLESKDIKRKLSTGVKEQVHWLARMALTRFLSKKEALPIILDEPFSEADDDRFLKTMQFLIGSGINSNQIIILSCHKQRHAWLETQLSDEEKNRLAFVDRLGIDVFEEEASSISG